MRLLKYVAIHWILMFLGSSIVLSTQDALAFAGITTTIVIILTHIKK